MLRDCCDGEADPAEGCCPECGHAGRDVGRITLEALIRPEALDRLTPDECRFCPTPECPIVYFSKSETFRREDVLVPVFPKEAEGGRIVCYCLAISEDQIRREMEDSGVSASTERIKALVHSGSCACEVRNPQGTCCLGDVMAIAKRRGGAA